MARGEGKIKISELNYRRRNDVKQVAKVFQEAFKQPPWSVNWPEHMWLEQIRHWRKLRDRFSGTVLVARINGEIVGAAAGHLMDQNEHGPTLKAKLGKGKHYYLRNLAVRPEFQKSGIGTALTDARLRRARRLRCTSVFGSTYENNTVRRRQFEKQGFRHFHTGNEISFDVNRKMAHYIKPL